MSKEAIALRITVLQPPPGVSFRLQRGRRELTAPTEITPEALSFDFTVRLAEAPRTNPPRLLGEYAQGPPAARFVYVNSGTLAGDVGSPWSRRAKVPLTSITWRLIDRVRATPGAALHARIAGTARDGGPACASVPLLGEAWHLISLGRSGDPSSTARGTRVSTSSADQPPAATDEREI